MRIGIIGAGITGLTLAYFLEKKGVDYKIFSKNTGGLIQSKITDDTLIEIGAGVLVGKPDLLNLISELKLEDEIIYPRIKNFQQLVYHEKVNKIPRGLKDLLITDLLSLKEKLHLIIGFFKKNNSIKSGTIDEVLIPIVGESVVKKILNPALMGIYGTGTEELSIKLVFPNLYKALSAGKSILQFLFSKAKPPRMFMFKNGFNVLIKSLYSKIPSLKVENIEVHNVLSGEKPSVITNQGKEDFDKVVICASGQELKKIIGIDDSNLESISLISLHFFCDKKVYPDAFGVLLPSGHLFDTVGIMFVSNIFPHTSNKNILKVLVKGNIELNGEKIQKIKHEIINIIGDVNLELVHQQPWVDAIPKYNLNRLNVDINLENIVILGADFNGIGVADRVRIAKEFSEKI